MSDRSSQPQNSWPTAGGGGHRRGLFDGEVRLKTSPRRVVAAQGAIQASVVFDPAGQGYVADLAGSVRAVDRRWHVLWQQQLEGGVSATPAIDASHSRIFVATQHGWAFALNTGDGAILWRRQIPSRSDPRILGDLLYLPEATTVVLSSWGGQYHELDAATGETRRTWDAGISPQAAACADEAGNVFSLRAVRGEGVILARRSPVGQEDVLHRVAESPRGASRMAIVAAPVFDASRQRVYFVTNPGPGSAVHAWSLASQRLAWSRPLSHGVLGTPAIRTDGALLVGDLGGKLHALSPDGTSLWEYDARCDYLLAGPVCDAAHRVFLPDPLGQLHVIDAQGRGRASTISSRSLQARPSFGPNGQLVLPGTDHRVHLLDNGTKTLPTS